MSSLQQNQIIVEALLDKDGIIYNKESGYYFEGITITSTEMKIRVRLNSSNMIRFIKEGFGVVTQITLSILEDETTPISCMVSYASGEIAVDSNISSNAILELVFLIKGIVDNG